MITIFLIIAWQIFELLKQVICYLEKKYNLRKVEVKKFKTKMEIFQNKLLANGFLLVFVQI